MTLMMSNGFNQNYELSISGGGKTDKTQHNISLGYRGNGFSKMIIITIVQVKYY